jgi:S-adenosylmethionine-diacylgycerolhomoserine-N-methlytransferase
MNRWAPSTMNLLKTISLLLQFGIRPIRGNTHAERLTSFYGYQASEYDDFRKSFLRGRDDLISHICFEPGCRWCDLGCGTGYMLTAADPMARQCSQITLVDLCKPLLDVASRKIAAETWVNAFVQQSDITAYRPEGEVDVVTFSYSLSMTPDWFKAIDRAWEILRPGGTIGVVDFYVARKFPISDDHRRQRIWTRHFWPIWFDIDNVHPSPDHIPYLHQKFQVEWFLESRTSVPGMPWIRPPYYCFVGRKPSLT